MGVAEKVSNGHTKPSLSPDSLINLDHGDPTLYEEYWKRQGEKCAVVFSGSDLMSYFSNTTNLCWFMEPELSEAIKRLHRTVGNAIVDDRYILVGTGSTQLFNAALYALSTLSATDQPLSVVSAAPYYSSFKEATELIRSPLYKWEGDASTFDKEGPYVEVVTSPSNPDGGVRDAVVGSEGGKLIYDFAYNWPQYTPITSAADRDIMLFTFSKCTGHAGSRIGWAIVKEKEVAQEMVKYLVLNSIGVSKESQLRAAKILQVVAENCQTLGSEDESRENFFEFGHKLMAKRWARLKDTVKNNELFALAKYPEDFCSFKGRQTEPSPAFAWLRCKEGTDCERLFAAHKIRTRGGAKFGSGPNYTRVSMLSRDEEFDLFLHRLSAIKEVSSAADDHKSNTYLESEATQ